MQSTRLKLNETMKFFEWTLSFNFLFRQTKPISSVLYSITILSFVIKKIVIQCTSDSPVSEAVLELGFCFNGFLICKNCYFILFSNFRSFHFGELHSSITNEPKWLGKANWRIRNWLKNELKTWIWAFMVHQA